MACIEDKQNRKDMGKNVICEWWTVVKKMDDSDETIVIIQSESNQEVTVLRNEVDEALRVIWY